MTRNSGIAALAAVLALVQIAGGPALAQDPDGATVVGRVTGAIGATKLAPDAMVRVGDRLETADDGALMVYMSGINGVVCAGPNSYLRLHKPNNIYLEKGMLRLYLSGGGDRSFIVWTPLGTMKVSGSVVWAAHDEIKNESIFATEDTPVIVDGISLEPGQYIVIRSDGPGPVEKLGKSTIRRWDRQLGLSRLLLSHGGQRGDLVDTGVDLTARGEMSPGGRKETAELVSQALASAGDVSQEVIDVPLIAPTPGGGKQAQSGLRRGPTTVNPGERRGSREAGDGDQASKTRSSAKRIEAGRRSAQRGRSLHSRGTRGVRSAVRSAKRGGR